MIFGFNIGSTMTGILASMVSSRDAKRLSLFHLLMNSVGTIVFYILCSFTPFITLFANIVSNPLHQVAHMHTFFNVITTIMVLFIDKYLEKIVYFIFPYEYNLANRYEEC